MLNLFHENSLLPVVVQDAADGQVLLLAYMNKQALDETLRTGKLHLWSRSRDKLWLKGEQSGNFQYVQEMRVNCEENSLLALVRPAGPACHDGYKSCFYRTLDSAGEVHITAERLFDPEKVYGQPKGEKH